MKTTIFAKPGSVDRKWVLIDAEGAVLGRLAVRTAMILMGKHRPTYTPHVDTGDFVVIINAGKVRVTGRKAEQKVYRHHTGYIGSLVERTFADLMQSNPAEVIELAVRRMLPKSRMGRRMFAKLKVYAGAEHPHGAQQPEKLEI